MGTRRGVIKKTAHRFSNPRAGGIIAMGVEEGDSVIAVQISDGKSEILIGPETAWQSVSAKTTCGRWAARRTACVASRFETTMKSSAWTSGARGTIVRHRAGLREADRAGRVSCSVPGGIGIINIQTSDRNGKVIGVLQVSDDDELMLITQQGKILRMASTRFARSDAQPRASG